MRALDRLLALLFNRPEDWELNRAVIGAVGFFALWVVVYLLLR